MEMSTIAGISTPLSNGGISVIRISGNDAIEIADKIYKGKTCLRDVKSHTISYGYIEEDGNIVDEVIVLVFKAPRSYTAEDVVEIQCHGGIVVTRKILKLLIENGAMLSEPGEFTKRAYLNGRIDLSQAESVMDIIQSKSDYELKASLGRLFGKLSEKIRNLRDGILDDIARIEAALDDPEHYEISEYRDEIKNHVINYKKEAEHLLKNAANGKIFKEGIRTVIIGRPNVGKSSLLNSLLRQDRAIVTDIAGTTRDTLEETISIGDMVLNIIDTAGIRNTEDKIEKIGVEKSLKAAKEADLILYMAEAGRCLDEDELIILDKLRDKRIIFIRNKCDILDEETRDFNDTENLNDIPVDMSIKEEKGIEELKDKIQELFYEGKLDFNREVYISSLRQEEELRGAVDALTRTLEGFENNMEEDFLTIDLMEAYRKMGRIIGVEVEDDIADRIFSKFCMGK